MKVDNQQQNKLQKDRELAGQIDKKLDEEGLRRRKELEKENNSPLPAQLDNNQGKRVDYSA